MRFIGLKISDLLQYNICRHWQLVFFHTDERCNLGSWFLNVGPRLLNFWIKMYLRWLNRIFWSLFLTLDWLIRDEIIWLIWFHSHLFFLDINLLLHLSQFLLAIIYKLLIALLVFNHFWVLFFDEDYSCLPTFFILIPQLFDLIGLSF